MAKIGLVFVVRADTLKLTHCVPGRGAPQRLRRIRMLATHAGGHSLYSPVVSTRLAAVRAFATMRLLSWAQRGQDLGWVEPGIWPRPKESTLGPRICSRAPRICSRAKSLGLRTDSGIEPRSYSAFILLRCIYFHIAFMCCSQVCDNGTLFAYFLNCCYEQTNVVY